MTADAESPTIPQRVALDALRMWLQARDELATPGGPQERLDAARKVLDLYLAQSGERELVDGESGRGCRLQPRRGTPSYDVLNMREQDPQLFERLFALGAVQVNHKIVTAQEQSGQVSGVAPWRMPGAVADSLIEVGGKSSN